MSPDLTPPASELATRLAETQARLEHETAAAAQARVERDRLATQLRALTPGDDSEASATFREPAPDVGPLPPWSTDEIELHIATDDDPDELRSQLEQWEPWRVEIIFSNGVRTSELKTRQPFTLHPLVKMALFERAVDVSSLRGGTALDIGFNCGYNAFHLASKHGMEVDGIDVQVRHLEVATFLAEVGNLANVDFMIDDAQTFLRPGRYDLVLHFGTLYHLPNPLLSLENTAKNLKPGGYLALETTCFTANDSRLVKYIRGYFGDTSNYWALSKPVLEEILELYGFEDVRLVHQSDLAQLDPGLARVLYVARKGGTAG